MTQYNNNNNKNSSSKPPTMIMTIPSGSSSPTSSLPATPNTTQATTASRSTSPSAAAALASSACTSSSSSIMGVEGGSHHHQHASCSLACCCDTVLSASPTTYVPLGEMRQTESTASLQLKLQRQQSAYRFFEWQPWLRLVWALHFAACMFMIALGSMNNHGERKYIPINIDAINDEEKYSNCFKGFVDVFATSVDDPGALFCCTGSPDDPLICQPPPSFLFFAGRLSRFPDAWLLPLLPLFVRGFVEMFRASSSTTTMTATSNTTTSTTKKSENAYARRRFFLYIVLIQFRGWILYLVFDTIEEFFVSDPGSACWYEELLHSNYKSCQGRVTDFSDHVVLYFAQILPIALVEVLHAFVVPFWESHSNTNSSSISSNHHPTTVYNNNKISTNSCTTCWGNMRHRIMTLIRGSGGRGKMIMEGWVIPLSLVLWLLNLYVVTFLGAYKTARYFHTGPETFMGFVVSLWIQIPLCVLQCTFWFPRAREYFYGQSIS